MKKSLALFFVFCNLIGSCMACSRQEPAADSTITQPTMSSTMAATSPAEVLGTEVSTYPSEQDITETTDSTGPQTDNTSPSEAEPTETTLQIITDSEKAETELEGPVHEDTMPQATTPAEFVPEETEYPETKPAETEPEETEPAVTKPTETAPSETEPTEPESEPTEPAPTEPTECQHDWTCIHHGEEGHWVAGVACSCGWTIYGDPAELVSLWNAHSASYPAMESLLYHGGYGSIDSWVVDKPAYDEWVCSHCGSPKP